MANDLRSFLKELEDRMPDELVRVSREVDPNLELCAVLRKLQEKNQYPAVLFARVKGTEIPVVANVMASKRKLALALGTTEDKLKEAYLLRQGKRERPVMVPGGPVKELVEKGDDLDLGRLPNIVHCGGDGGPYISSGVVIVKDPDTGIRNAAIYRMQIKGRARLGIWPGEYSHGGLILKKRESRGEPMEVAIVIGHHPAFYLGAQYRGPMEVDELDVVGGLMGEPLKLVRCETVDLEVPADAEIVIEGRVPPGVREMEGPFGEYTWYMGEALKNPVVEVSAVTRRSDAIYQDLFSAHPEHNLLGAVAREAILFERVKGAIPTLKDVALPFSGTCRHTAYVSIKKTYDGAGKNAALAALAADPFIKLAVVVDEDVDISNDSEVLWAICTRVQADRDVFVVPDAYVCELDPSAYSIADRAKRGALNAKWAIDATMPVGLPFQVRADVPEELWKGLKLKDYLEAPKRKG